jgi:Skp family chaperone for outer membrane proteins
MENRDVEHLIDMLYDMINEAKGMPFASEKCVIERDAALDLLEDIRNGLPAELKRAQDLIQAKEDYVNSAKREVGRMMQQAESDAKSKVSDSEVLMAARERGREIVQRAEDRSNEMYRVVNEYTEDALRRTEEAIQAALDEVKESRIKFRAASAARRQKDREELSKPTRNDTKNSD